MRAAVCLAAMMPATRAAWGGSPFRTAPVRMSRRASRDIAIDPRATASRSVTGLSPTSTILTRPRASTCDSSFAGRPDLPDLPGPRDLLRIVLALSQEERQAFERHGEIDA